MTNKPVKQDQRKPWAVLTHKEVAEIMTANGYPMSPANVSKTERRAFRKLRKKLEAEYKDCEA